jgi:diguanylate cyclase (GGDEF)-like protein
LGDALAYLKAHKPYAVVTDLSLPDARGLDCVSALRQAAPDAPLIVSSGNGDESLAVQAVRLGAQDFVLKDELSPKLLSRILRYAAERKEAELELRQLANYDELTGLANRRSFQRELTRALARARRDDAQGAVLFCDLNGFKPINDRFGHQVGDDVLTIVGQRLSLAMRESDFVARLGGDEFAIIAERVCTHADAETVAQRIYQALSPRMVAHGNELTVGVSIGIALFPESGEAVEDLLNAADMAMYASKRLGDSTPMLASMLPRPDTKPPA